MKLGSLIQRTSLGVGALSVNYFPARLVARPIPSAGGRLTRGSALIYWTVYGVMIVGGNEGGDSVVRLLQLRDDVDGDARLHLVRYHGDSGDAGGEDIASNLATSESDHAGTGNGSGMEILAVMRQELSAPPQPPRHSIAYSSSSSSIHISIRILLNVILIVSVISFLSAE
ncbi:hypothetical protein Tco_0856882 [Tanacetum coccineum]|uniref:Uncharacterized protein n=1 Tax=Tanacetum coccineum TaxID=301880 RepID=A0ABQ5B4L8_9ASTR